ncbi:MAG: 4-hydroxythreonine-4-phosphate dehydrogenase PdxA [Candidatus Poribacteria bacterium]|nr:4-hydroxythreonine-4-phosphate dehydrogenase PdxA [Candidatus Poribacteria bacterium]MDD9973008.1 4-hydroxythreonine-4-phosphate dehydrogenase PdxA [Candidatus Poribacteria bacterium]
MIRTEVQIQSEAVGHRTSTPRTANKPKIGITMGDAAGIGPEIIVKALARKDVYLLCQPIVIGSPAIFQDACSRFTTPSRTPQLKLNIIGTPLQANAKYGTIDVLDVSSITPQDISVGTIDARAGAAAVKAIETGTHLAMQSEIDAITTAPICKAAIHRAGIPYPGHTEMLAAFTNTPHEVMMLCTPEALMSQQTNDANNKVAFAVSFVTSHIALTDVPKYLSVQRIVEVIRVTQEVLVRCGIPEPRLVVAGLNPHAGEEGMFGKEEEHFIRPAIEQVKAHAHPGTIDGPLPADALFVKASQGEWDAVIAMYHDQGNIPIKLLGFGDLVNVTLGLPIVRTSVDHGTAFDIAGKGIASENSLVAALNCASQLVKL